LYERARLCRAYTDRLVRETDWKRFAVDVAVSDDSPHAEIVTGAQDAQSDLAAIGDQDLPEQRLLTH
jgi:hypothetical protein